ncbi:MAG: ABC transporter substrate-binding protein [Pseudomonadota bacterium]
MNKKILISSLLIVAVIAVVIFIQTQPQDKSVKIGVLQSWILEGPFYVAEEQGFYEEEGVNAEIVEIGSVDEFVPAIVSKDILVAETIADMFIVQSTQESNIKQIMRKATLHGLDGIVTTKDVNSAKDLRGKEIAVQTISPSHYLLLNYLRDGGVSSDEVTLLPTEAGNAGAAFLTGKIDVAVTWEPWLSRASEREGGKILFSTKDSPNLIYDILITRGDLTEQEQEDVKAVMRAWYKALAWMDENPEETVDIFSRRLGLPKEEVEFFFTKLDFMNYEDNLQFYGTKDNLGPVEAYTNEAAQIWQEENIIELKPDPAIIIETSYLNELYK